MRKTALIFGTLALVFSPPVRSEPLQAHLIHFLEVRLNNNLQVDLWPRINLSRIIPDPNDPDCVEWTLCFDCYRPDPPFQTELFALLNHRDFEIPLFPSFE